MLKFFPIFALLILSPAMSLAGQSDQVRVVPVEKTIEYFPCSRCHQHVDEEMKSPDSFEKVHGRITFQHMKQIKDCNFCHDKKDYNYLRLFDGTRVDFNSSYQVCLQCHGEKKKDWETGVHGKQVGSWKGIKYRSSCVECHDAHFPQFKKVKADPAPPRPKLGIKKGAH